MRDAQVAIVGAGPAGSTLALLLARAGVDVLLIDRATFPRVKPCGDCLSAEVTRILERLGVLGGVLARGPARLAGWRIVSPDGCAFESRFDDLAFADPCARTSLAMPRAELDAVLLDAARAAGASAYTGAAVIDFEPGYPPLLRVRTRARTHVMRPRLVVGADGLRSVVSRRARAVRRHARIRKLSLTAHVEGAELPGPFGEMHVAPTMCAGLAPVGHDRFNLTIVAESDRHGRSVAQDAFAFFRGALRAFPLLPSRLVNATCEGVPLLGGTLPACTPRLHASGPFDAPTRRVAGRGWVLLGDAAGYFDPFTGQGIHQAMRGAEILAPLIMQVLHSSAAPAPLHAWTRAHRRLSAPGRRLQQLIDAVLRRPHLADAAIRRLRDAPRAAGAMLAVTADLRHPLSLLSPDVLFSFAAPTSRRRAP